MISRRTISNRSSHRAQICHDNSDTRWSILPFLLSTLFFIGVLASTAYPYDVGRLCDAIAWAETSNGKTAREETNLWNIYHWQEGERKLHAFANVKLGKEYCMGLWGKAYGRFPQIEDALRWTGEPENAEAWLATVKRVYTPVTSFQFIP